MYNEDKEYALINFRNYSNKTYINNNINRWIKQGRDWNYIFTASFCLEDELSNEEEITPELDKIVEEEVIYYRNIKNKK
jgi:hypothetical protein